MAGEAVRRVGAVGARGRLILAVLRSSGRRPRPVENGTTALLGLAGRAVARVVRDDVADERARVVYVVTDDPAAARCPGCGTTSSSPKAWATTRPKDVPYGPDPVELVWRKRRWRCRNQACRRKT